MDWLDRMNRAMDYIEENLADEISYRQHRTIPPRQASGAHRDIIPLC